MDDKNHFYPNHMSQSRKKLQRRHNEHNCVSNHRRHDCLLNRLFRRRSKKTPKLLVAGFVRGIHRLPVNSPHKGPIARKIFPDDDITMELILKRGRYRTHPSVFTRGLRSVTWWRHQTETFSALLALRGIHRSPVNSPHKGQWRGALMFSLICVRINGWVNIRDAGDLRRRPAHYNVIVMYGLHGTGAYSYANPCFRVTSLALDQPYDCPATSEAILRNFGN